MQVTFFFIRRDHEKYDIKMTNQSLGITEKHLKRQLPLTGVYKRLYLHVYLILITLLPIIRDFSISLKGTGLSTKLSTIVAKKSHTKAYSCYADKCYQTPLQL